MNPTTKMEVDVTGLSFNIEDVISLKFEGTNYLNFYSETEGQLSYIRDWFVESRNQKAAVQARDEALAAEQAKTEKEDSSVIDLSKVQPGQTLILRNGDKRVVESIGFDESLMTFPYHIKWANLKRFSLFKKDGRYIKFLESPLDVVGIVEAGTEIKHEFQAPMKEELDLMGGLTNPLFEEVTREEPTIAKPTTIAESLLALPRKSDAEKELFSIKLKGRAVFKFTLPKGGLILLGFRDGSQVIGNKWNRNNWAIETRNLSEI